MLSRDWQAAADAFAQVGWTCDQALMLSPLDDADAPLEALRLARESGDRASDTGVSAGCAADRASVRSTIATVITWEVLRP